MPLNATFVADFTSFLNATQKAIVATENLQAAAGKVGPAYDNAARESAAANEKVAEARQKVLDDAEQLGRKVGDNLKDLAGKTVDFVSKYVDAFAEAERVTANLSVALANAGAPPGTLESYEAMATSLSKVSRYSAGSIQGVEALFTSVGNVKPDQMQAALQATVDLAAGLAGTGQAMSLEQAARLVAKAAASDGESIGKLKQILGDSYEPAKGFAGIMEAINTKFGGQAAKDVETYAGATERLKNQMSELDEKVGKTIVPTLEKMLGLFQKLPEPVQTVAIGVGSIGKEVAPVLVSLASLVTLLGSTGLGAALAGAAEAVGVFLAGLVGWPALIVAALAAAGLAIWHWRDDIRDAMESAWQEQKRRAAVMADAFKPIAAAAAEVYNGVKTWLYDKLSALYAEIFKINDALAKQIVAAFQWLYNTLIGHSIVPDLIGGISKQFGLLGSVMVDPAMNAAQGVIRAFDQIQLPNMFSAEQYGATGIGQAGASQFVKFPLVFGGSTSALTEQAIPGAVININMSGMLGTDDPQTRGALRDIISDAIMRGMRNTRLMGTA